MRCLAGALALQLCTALPPVPAAAQGRGAPPDLIARAASQFEEQEYEESIQTLSAALVRPTNTKSQKMEIYRLLALNCITLNRKDEAEAAVRGLLALDPAYSLPERESPRFRDFFATVKQKWENEGKPGVTAANAGAAAVGIQHFSPPQTPPDTPMELTAQLEDPRGRVMSIKLFYRGGASGRFVPAGVRREGQTVHATIPSKAVRPPLVEYYFLGFDAGGLPIVALGDVSMPMRTAITEPKGNWVVPAMLGGMLGAAITVGVLAVAGAFKSAPSSVPPP